MNQRRTEPEEDEKVPTEDGEVQAEPVEMQGEVREEPVDWTEDGEDMELVEQAMLGMYTDLVFVFQSRLN